MEIVEGKDRPERPKPLYNEEGKIMGLLLRLYESIYSTGKVIILHSGFCVHNATINLRKKGVFASALIKEQRYWPKHVDGEVIKNYMSTKEVGSTHCLPGEKDGVKVDAFALKEPNYVMLLMSTWQQHY
eukprot:13428119-Ditylum_brightwellii.AAC.1